MPSDRHAFGSRDRRRLSPNRAPLQPYTEGLLHYNHTTLPILPSKRRALAHGQSGLKPRERWLFPGFPSSKTTDFAHAQWSASELSPKVTRAVLKPWALYGSLVNALANGWFGKRFRPAIQKNSMTTIWRGLAGQAHVQTAHISDTSIGLCRRELAGWPLQRLLQAFGWRRSTLPFPNAP